MILYISQPNGKFAQWSTATDSIVGYNMTRKNAALERIGK